MRDEAEKKLLTVMSDAWWVTVPELIKAGAGEFSFICASLARLESTGFVASRQVPGSRPPQKEYCITRKGVGYWAEWVSEES